MHFSQGWVQFGYRFSNDFVVFALPLVALGMRQPRAASGWLGFGLDRAVGRRQPLGRDLGQRAGMVSASSRARVGARLRASPRRLASGRRRARRHRQRLARAHARRRVLGHRRVPDGAAAHGHGPPDRLPDLRAPRLARQHPAHPDRRAGVPDHGAVAGRRGGRRRRDRGARPPADRLDDRRRRRGARPRDDALVWVNATRADPHALHLAFVAAAPARAGALGPTRRAMASIGSGRTGGSSSRRVLFGLAAGNHSLTLLLVPPIALYVLAVEPGILAPAAVRRGLPRRGRAHDGARLPRAAAPGGLSRPARRWSTASPRPGMASGTSRSPSSSGARSATCSRTCPKKLADLVTQVEPPVRPAALAIIPALHRRPPGACPGTRS